MGIKTWWLEATTYGYIKAARKVDITIICGTGVITCHACYKRTVVYDRNIRDPTPYYEVQSLSNPNIPVDKGWFAWSWWSTDLPDDCPIIKYELYDDIIDPPVIVTSSATIILKNKSTPKTAYIDVDTTTPQRFTGVLKAMSKGYDNRVNYVAGTLTDLAAP